MKQYLKELLNRLKMVTIAKKKSTHNKKVLRLSTTIKVGMLLVALTPLINS